MKYKVGDRVLTNENSVYYERMFNKTATIIYIDSVTERYLLEFDEYVDGHSGQGEFNGKDGHCWFVWENDFELIESTHLKFKKGDKVIIKSNECRLSYLCTLECIGTIVEADYKQYIDDERITYRVRIDNLDNKYQVDGLWVFHEEKSLELCTAKMYEPTPYQLYRPNGIGNIAIDTMSDYIDNYITQAVLDKPTEETKTFKIKGENEMNKREYNNPDAIIMQMDKFERGEINITDVLEIYRTRKENNIYNKYYNKREQIKNTDSIYKKWNDAVKILKEIYKKQNSSFDYNCEITEPELCDETNVKMADLYSKEIKERETLRSTLQEVLAQLSICETYEQKQSVLKLYKVIDENGRINA